MSENLRQIRLSLQIALRKRLGSAQKASRLQAGCGMRYGDAKKARAIGNDPCLLPVSDSLCLFDLQHWLEFVIAGSFLDDRQGGIEIDKYRIDPFAERLIQLDL